MNEERLRFIEVWAKEIKTNPSWKKQHTHFINAQIYRSNNFYKRLAKTPNGVEKIMRITHCKRSLAENLLNSK